MVSTYFRMSSADSPLLLCDGRVRWEKKRKKKKKKGRKRKKRLPLDVVFVILHGIPLVLRLGQISFIGREVENHGGRGQLELSFEKKKNEPSSFSFWEKMTNPSKDFGSRWVIHKSKIQARRMVQGGPRGSGSLEFWLQGSGSEMKRTLNTKVGTTKNQRKKG